MPPERYLSLRHARADWLRVKSEIAYVRVLILAQRLREAILRDEAAARLNTSDGGAVKFREDQPRLPAGHTGGGQWTSGAGGAGGAGGHPDKTENVKLAFAGPAVEKAVEALAALWVFLSARNTADSTALLEFNAREFLPGATPEHPAIATRPLTREDVDASCPRNGLVQELTNKASEAARAESYNLRPAEFGTLVHSNLKVAVNSLKDRNFRAERSAVKSQEEDYGTPDSVRVDVIENVGDGTVCVYDIKTGKSKLSLLRMQEIADNVHSLFPGTKKVLLIEKRPR
jgi:hypothetical protein